MPEPPARPRPEGAYIEKLLADEKSAVCLQPVGGVRGKALDGPPAQRREPPAGAGLPE